MPLSSALIDSALLARTVLALVVSVLVLSVPLVAVVSVLSDVLLLAEAICSLLLFASSKLPSRSTALTELLLPSPARIAAWEDSVTAVLTIPLKVADEVLASALATVVVDEVLLLELDTLLRLL